MSAPQQVPFTGVTHIVLFRDEYGLKSFLGSTGLRSAIGHGGDFGGVHASTKVYAGLNAVATHLSEAQVEVLRKSEANVFPNEACYLPKFEIHEPLTTFALASADSRQDSASGADSFTWALRAIGLTEEYRYSGTQVKVAVLDTGVDENHGDLVKTFSAENAASFVPNEGISDYNGHGTHCAGVIASRRPSSGALSYGVAPGSELLIGKVFDSKGRGTDDFVVSGIDWASAMGARVVSMSFEKPRRANAEPSKLYEALAAKLLARGCFMVAASGNRVDESDNNPVSDPAACKGILGVAAVDEFEKVASFSRGATDRRGKVDLAAPGVKIHSAWPGGGFKVLSGTSMAVPHVAGAAALYFEAFPDLATADIMKVILERCTQGAFPFTFGRGVIRVP